MDQVLCTEGCLPRSGARQDTLTSPRIYKAEKLQVTSSDVNVSCGINRNSWWWWGMCNVGCRVTRRPACSGEAFVLAVLGRLTH
jgi:hypothetical protein